MAQPAEDSPWAELEARLAEAEGRERFDLLLELAMTVNRRGEFNRAEALIAEAAALVPSLEDDWRVAYSLDMARAWTLSGAGDQDTALDAARRAVELAREHPAPEALGSALLCMAYIHSNRDDDALALEAYDEAYAVLEPLGPSEDLATVVVNSGYELRQLAAYPEALSRFLEARDIAEAIDDRVSMGFALLNMSDVYKRMGQTDEAETALRAALEAVEGIDAPALEGLVRDLLGRLFLDAGKPREALPWLERSRELLTGTDRRDLLASAMDDLGRAWLALGDDEQALDGFELARALAAEAGAQDIHVRALHGIAEVYRQRGDTTRAIEVLETAVATAREHEQIEQLWLRLKNLSEVYGEAGRWQDAYAALSEYEQLKTESLDQGSRRLLATMQARYEAEERDREIELLRKDQALQEAEIRNERNRRRGLVIVFIILIALLMLLFNRYRLQMRATRMREAVDKERQVNERLRAVDRLKDEFLANTSHELRTPLFGITGLAESLIDGAAGEVSEPVKENLSMIVASGRRLGHLVNDILDFSKLRHHSLELDRHSVELQPVVDVVLTLSRQLVGDKDLRLVNAVELDLPAVDADENRLQQILYNLIGNAIKFTEQGVVEVSAERADDDHLAIHVRDTGIGIPLPAQARIFDAFEQAETSVDRSHGGTGLGLAVTRQLVELHGGQIKVESTPGDGTTFTFTLPIAAPGAEVVTAPTAALMPPMPVNDSQAVIVSPTLDAEVARILAVDDESVNRQVIRNYLAGQPFELVTAASGDEALALLERERFDLVLLDVMMPKVSGFEVCRVVREEHPMEDLPVLFLTAKNQSSDVVTGLSLGANDYLAKPIARDELLARIRPHLGLLHVNRNLDALVQQKMSEIKVLEGLLPICSSCKKIRDDDGEWNELESYIDEHSEAEFTHGFCPDCLEAYKTQHGLL
ncbi:MAG: ATP-binding protein [Acidobacteriota bacterium]